MSVGAGERVCEKWSIPFITLPFSGSLLPQLGEGPSWLICCENDHVLLISLERDTARRLGARTTVLQSSHVPMLSRPGDVADIIAGAATELAGGPVENAIPAEKTPIWYGQAGS